MKSKSIKAIFTNIIFVIGIGLSTVGFIYLARTTARTIFFPQYPLQTYEESQCQIVGPDFSKQEKDSCYQNLEKTRRVNQTTDFTTSISLIISGLFLTFAFKKFIFD